MRAAVFVVLACAALAVAQESVVKTKLGDVHGNVLATNREFRGVPFAQPPVDELRWQSPKAVEPWKSPLDATKDQAGCPQDCKLPHATCPPVMSEDCLYLNIFTPRLAHLDKPKPVMVFIHGGNFKQGYAGGLLYNGGPLANNTDVVVVVLQYRLGALGFFYTGDTILGNNGLQDQRMALKWLAENIGPFGGDPNSITVFGQSAGAMSIASHIASPDSKGLFNRGILESEPFGLPFRTPDTWKGIGNALAKYAGCDTADVSYDACLRNQTTDTIVAAQVKAEKDLLASITHLLEVFLPWTPTAGVDELPQQPWNAWVDGNTNDVPILIGTVTNEGWEFIYEAYPTKNLTMLDEEILLDFVFGLSHEAAINKQYPNNDYDNRAVASHVARGGPPVYLYHFDHIMSFSPAVWGKNYSFCDHKVCHGEELVFVFGVHNASYGVVYTDDEKVLSDSIQFYWSNFAATGNPNTPPSGSTLNASAYVTWPSWTSHEDTLKLHTPVDVVETAPFRDTCKLWDSFGYNFA